MTPAKKSKQQQANFLITQAIANRRKNMGDAWKMLGHEIREALIFADVANILMAQDELKADFASALLESVHPLLKAHEHHIGIFS